MIEIREIIFFKLYNNYRLFNLGNFILSN